MIKYNITPSLIIGPCQKYSTQVSSETQRMKHETRPRNIFDVRSLSKIIRDSVKTPHAVTKQG